MTMLNARPENYEAIQKEWCECRNESIQRSAVREVRQAIRECGKLDLPYDKVLVIGPQHGYELLAFKKCGVRDLMAIDAVWDFCQECQSLGFSCAYLCAENMTMTTKGWGVYASHALEHCYDIAKAVENIKAIALWCYVVVPVEPDGARDEAHFSCVRSIARLPELFSPWRIRWDEYSYRCNKTKCNARYLFTP